VTVVHPAASSRGPSNDALLRAGRLLLLISLLLSSALVARIGDYTAGDLALGAALVVTLFAVAIDPGELRRRALPLWPLVITVCVVGGGSLSGLRAQSAGSTLAVVVRLVLVIVLLPWLGRVLLRHERDVRAALTAFVAGCGLTGAGTILQFVFGEAVIPNTSITNAGRFAGLTQNVSDTGGICCVGVVGAIALAATASGRRGRIVPLLALVGAIFGLILSGSVSGLLSAAIGFTLLGLSRVLRPRAIVASIAGFAVVLAASIAIQTASGALNPIQRILQTTGNSADDRYNTAGSRVSTYTEALRQFTESPIIGNGLDPNSTIADGIYPAHNLFLASAFEGGVILLLGVALAVLRPLWGLRVRILRTESLVAMTFALVVTELVFAMTAPSLYNRYFWIPVALLLLARGVRARSLEQEPAATPLPRASTGSVELESEFHRSGDPIAPSRKRHS
jgi:O-antigen ligase